jgi:methylenetetrahydrofolate--tRNA-(uracil-5-)-methyltransferase
MPPPEVPKKIEGVKQSFKDKAVARKHAYTSRALADFKNWLAD